MGKVLQKDPTQWFPMPAVLVTCAGKDRPNVMGLGYIGFASWQPPVLGLGINSARYSRDLIREAGEFVVNVPEAPDVLRMDYCGFISGVSADKFAAAGLTPVPAAKVKAPLIQECPINIECVLSQVVPVGSHELFLGEVVAVHVDDECVAGRKTLVPLLLLSRKYMALSEYVCEFGASAGAPPDARAGREHECVVA
jgi:flavin reductase (DIM6/NTAB) family NADH-FMN oxidoreductase RutF